MGDSRTNVLARLYLNHGNNSRCCRADYKGYKYNYDVAVTVQVILTQFVDLGFRAWRSG